MKLYEISEQLNGLWEAASEAVSQESVVTPSGEIVTRDDALARLERALSEAEGTLEKKALDIACLIKESDAEADAIAAEQKKLAARKKSADAKASWLRSYLESHVPRGTKFKDARAVISWRKSEAVDVLVPAESLPERFRRIKTVVEPDKTALKEALKAGAGDELTNLAVLSERESVQIK